MSAPSRYWLVKQEPASYSFARFTGDKTTAWTGVRNFQARNNLRAMKKGDPVAYYHSVEEKQVVGLAKVSKEAFPDPTAEEGDWSAVELTAHKALKNPVTLATFKADPILKETLLVRQSRLSVVPLTEKQFKRIIELAG